MHFSLTPHSHWPKAFVVTAHVGKEIEPHLEAVAALRMTVFREFPYLYEGDLEYERRYLSNYLDSDLSVLVLARAQDGIIVGASTAMPLRDDDAAFSQPFRAQGLAVDSVFYFGESVLLPNARGHGLGHVFFDAREQFALHAGQFDCTAFCAVVRDRNDPRRPPQHRDNDRFWLKRGYAPVPNLICHLSWRELGNQVESDHTLQFWTHHWSAINR